MLIGTFPGQNNKGEVVITETPDSIVLTLKDFSTPPGDDLTVEWNPGAMTKNAAGDNVVEDPAMFLIASLKSLTGTPQSITIYNYKTREAFGTANLHEE